MAMTRMMHRIGYAMTAIAGFAAAVFINHRADLSQPTVTELVATEAAVAQAIEVPANQEELPEVEDVALTSEARWETVASSQSGSIVMAQASPSFPAPRLAPTPIPPEHLVPPPHGEPKTIDQPSPFDELLQQEIDEPTSAELEVWRSELKDLPIDAAREILKLRRSIDFSPAAPKDNADLPFPSSPPPDPLFLPEPPRSLSSVTQAAPLESANVIEKSLHDLRLAHRVVANNIANSLTPGFKRLELIWRDAAYQSPSANVYLGAGSSLTETRVDFSNGELEKSSSPWNVAIEGAGWFQVQYGEEICVTRSGRFSIHDGLLGVRIGSAFWHLEPRVHVPSDDVELVIQPDGTVHASGNTPEETSSAFGRIQLVSVPTDSLTPLGQSLYVSNTARPIVAGDSVTDTVGQLRQGFRERSNVDFQTEIDGLKRLETHIQRLQQIVNGLAANDDPLNLSRAQHSRKTDKPRPASHTDSLPPAIAE
ncbi:flagellar hook basal-body protein [Thalassoroseus pseudoceratinae]|uniref:flagellar hook basal-body protein n=1 Tax=Thalassoroseus pseudoceratinae TaxID=2713176 RepID=UPI0014217BBE|nr:flagellar hook basal-body protein [Thalassoroseus pseudoceratinae]